jgi:hypothetical protein
MSMASIAAAAETVAAQKSEEWPSGGRQQAGAMWCMSMLAWGGPVELHTALAPSVAACLARGTNFVARAC